MPNPVPPAPQTLQDTCNWSPSTAYSTSGFIRLKALFGLSAMLLTLVAIPIVLASPRFAEIRKAPLSISSYQKVFANRSARTIPTPFAAQYTWNQTGTASYTTSTNWNPTRTTPAIDDILVFNNGATTTVTNVPPGTTIGAISVGGGTQVTLEVSPAGTFTLSGGFNCLDIASGSSLNIDTANALNLNIASGSTAQIGGSMTFSGGPHTLTAADPNAIKFIPGSTFTQGASVSGNVFGNSGSANTVIFATGSNFVQLAGSDPFGLTEPNSKVIFQTGSNFKLNANLTPSFSGRTYANFEYNPGAGTNGALGGSAVSIDNLTITSGTFNFSMTGTPGHAIKGNISVATGATLNFNPASAGTINLSGPSAQTISNSGTFTTSANQTFDIGNTAGVTLNYSLTFTGPTIVDSGAKLATTGTLTANAPVTINGSFQINQGGFADGSATWTYAANANLIFNNSSGSYGFNGENYWPAANGPQTVKVLGAGGLTMSATRTVGTLFEYASGVSSAQNLTLNGTCQVDTGGFTAGSPTYGAASLLKYNVNGSYGRNGEWLPNVTSGAGYPANVQLSNNTNLDLANGSAATFTLDGNLTVDSGSTMKLNGPPTANLAVKGNFANSGTYTPGSQTLTFNGGAAQTWSDSNSQNFGAVVINNASTGVTLNSNTSVSTLTDTAGALNLNGFTLSNSGTLSIGSTLKGTGTVSGAVSVGSGGAIAPGNSPGIINSGSVTFTSGSNFNVEIGGITAGSGYDQLNVSGTVTLGNATLNLSQFGGFTPTTGQTFTIINNDSNDAISGTFTGLSEGATIPNFIGSGFSANISYVGGDGNDVVLTPAITPGTVAFVGAPYTTSEGNADHDVSITVSRTGGSDGALDVTYGTSDGSATAGSDYLTASSTLHWNAGESGNKSFLITVKGDTTYEANETVNITLSNPTGGATITPPAATTLTINNDDTPPATLTVNTTDDVDNGACLVSHCSLREAINAANFSPLDSTINFNIPGGDPGCTGGVCTIKLTGALPDVSTDTMINGTGASTLTVQRDTGGLYRIFTVTNGAAVQISDLTVSNGALGVDGQGGGIRNSAALTLTNVTVSGNSVSGSGGTVNQGGGIYNAVGASLTVTDCTFSNNFVSGNLTNQAGAIHNDGGTLNISGSSLSTNHASGGTNNQGGGIWNNGTATVDTTTLSGNFVSGGDFDWGGAILNTGSGTLKVTNSTLSANQTSGTTEPFGAGIYNDFPSTTTITNGTLSGNNANTGQGGGVFNKGTLNLNNSTLAANIASSGGGIFNAATLNFINTIVAINTGVDCTTFPSSTISTNKNNLVGDGTCFDNGVNFHSGSPGLASLGDNGGPTKTMALSNGSQAIDAGDDCVFDNTCSPALGTALTTDQRGTGFSREIDGNSDGTAHVDIGAYEAATCTTPPVTPTASNGGPYREGATISLSTPTVAGATYSWTGPNGFTSTQQNPTRSNATTADAGTYSVTITVNGCSSAAGTTNVVVNATPATPTASNGGPYCEGATISLSTPTVAGATYSWTGPNGFTSSQQNPTRTNATTANAGTYSVTITVNGCTSAAGTTNVVVNATPATPTASNGGPYCEGQTIQLSTPTVAGATYSWTGPNGFTSSQQNPTRANATTADAGTYSITITVNGCTSAAGATNVVVNATPATPTASNGGPYCVGGTIQLATPTVGGATYAWTGPNGFTSSQQNPTRSNATTADAGTYSVTITVNGCSSAAGTTNVVVNTPPTLVVNSSLDDADANPGDSICETGSGNGICTLRAAIQEANLSCASSVTINFDPNVFVPPSSYGILINSVLPALHHNIAIVGPGADTVSIDGQGSSQIFQIDPGFITSISGLTITNGHTTNGAGGGIFNRGTLTLSDSVVSNNSASRGGGIDSEDSSSLIVKNTIISGNSATKAGGGIRSVESLKLVNSVVSKNTASKNGGGIHNDVADGLGSAKAVIVNSTIIGNMADADNTGNDGLGGGLYNNLGSVKLVNTIVATNVLGNSADNDIDGSPVDAAGSSHNLIGNGGAGGLTNGVNGNQVGVNPMLDANGLPVAGSPAINNGDNCVLNDSCAATLGFNVTTDQRGIARPQGPQVDIGAFEVRAFVVNTTVDHDDGACEALSPEHDCTLREAILAANENPNSSIIFGIPGNDSGCDVNNVCTISPAVDLPQITAPVFIDGYSQPGAHSNTKHLNEGDDAVLTIVVNGANDTSPASRGLDLEAGSDLSTVRGLIINHWNSAGIFIQDSSSNTISGNFIGTDAAGAASAGGTGAGVLITTGCNPGTADNLIGGDLPEARNIISGNGAAGIDIGAINGTCVELNTVEGNYIGTDRTGKVALANATHGIKIENGSEFNIIGCEVLDGDNVISGNSDAGIFITETDSCLVEGNFIGTDCTGTAALGNKRGVVMLNSFTNQIGFPGFASVISGNLLNGIEMVDTSTDTCDQNFVQGNLIGTDLNGTAAIANGQSGILINGSSCNLVGGGNDGEGNLISGNGDEGIALLGTSFNLIQGNFIGTDISGSVALGNAGHGIEVYISASVNATDNIIGGGQIIVGERARIIGERARQAGARKSAARTAANGLAATTRGKFPVSIANRLAAIKTAKDAAAILNRQRSVAASRRALAALPRPATLHTSSARRQDSGQPSLQNGSTSNLISGNGGDGVRVSSDGDFNNLISQNSITANGGLGINLGTDGVTPNNSLDHTTGPNHYQNFPVINSADPNTQNITYTFDTTGGTGPFVIEFFVNDVCDGTNGEGKTFIGATNVESSGTFNFTAQVSFAAGQIITATASDNNNNTSEFSPCFCTATPATPTASNDGPYCTGATIHLFTPDVSGATFSWTGPNGFSSNQQNPTRTNVTTADAGTYFVTVSVGGCPSSAGSTTVVVNPSPASFTVNNSGDSGDAFPGDGFCGDLSQQCTLRAAIEEANASLCSGTIDINFAIGSSTIQVASQLTVDHNVNVVSPAINSVIINGGTLTRLFTINGGRIVSISNLTLTKGNGSGGDGGAVLNNGALTLNGVTLNANNAVNGGAISNTGTLSMINTTISGNAANGDGGGLFNGPNPATLTNVTVAYNRVDNDNNATGAGGGIFSSGGTVLIHNTIVADNYVGSSPSTTADNVGGTLNSNSSYNLIGAPSGGLTNGTNHNQVGVATALLGALMNNGGPTFTHGLLYNSPAVDAGDGCVFTNTCSPPLGSTLTSDQRGLSRQSNGDLAAGTQVDIGAYERQSTETRNVNSGGTVTVDLNDVRVTFPCTPAGGCTRAHPEAADGAAQPIKPAVTGATLSITDVDPATQPAPPPGFVLGNNTTPPLPTFDVTPSALTFDPPATVCFYLPSINDPVFFDGIRLFHNSGSSLDLLANQTRDFPNRLVCGATNSFSAFVGGHTATPTATNGTVSGQILDNNGSPVEGAAIRMTGTQNRLTITDAAGNYHFDNVETNGFYVITPSRANFGFSPSQKSFSQLGAHTEATFTGATTGGSANPLDTTEYFVRQQYLDFLGREPDESGFNFWVNNISNCGVDTACREVKRVDTSAAFFFSIEFQQTGYLVYRAYESAYGNLAAGPVPLTLNEIKPDTHEISNGVVVLESGWQQTLENNKRAFMNDFVQRARFKVAYPAAMTPTDFVSKLFGNAHVDQSDSDYAASIAEFAGAADTSDAAARARVLRRIAENSTFSRSQFNQAFVLMEYFGYLRRDPNSGQDTDFSGYNFWLGKLNQFDGSFEAAEMVKAFLSATEYRGRFPR